MVVGPGLRRPVRAGHGRPRHGGPPARRRPSRTLVAARPWQTPEHLPEPVHERWSYLWC